MPHSSSINNKLNKGFTLIEVIVGIVVFSISLSIILQLIIPTEKNSADQIHQIKAAQLGQALLDDIMSRSFDENSNRAGGLLRCDEDWNLNGTIEVNEGCTDIGLDDGETIGMRSQFDDVDDFNGYTSKVDSIEQGLAEGYNSFTLDVVVNYLIDSSTNLTELYFDNTLENRRLAKRITVTVTTPLGTAIAFTTYKANF